MDFSFTEEQTQIAEAISKICAHFGDEYWLSHDHSGEFPHEFCDALATDGWLGIAMPESQGGAGLGITEAALMMQTIAESGAAMSGCSAVHMNIFGPNVIVVFGTEEQKQRMLPPLIAGKAKACFGVTEPDAGLDTTHLKTKAVRKNDHYVVSGHKVWTSTAQVADKILLIARTRPLEECDKASEGLSLFYTDLDRTAIEVREIEKMGRKAVDSNELFINDLRIPFEDRIGEEGKGFQYLLHGLNPERVLIAAEAVGVGKAALSRASQYAKDRKIFGRAIGQNQSIQHPLAQSWCELEAAQLMCFRAASLYDQQRPCGVEANAAKFLSARAGFTACERSILTHGGYGYAKEFHVERFMREQWINRIAPVTEQLMLCYIAEKALGLPKSY